MKPTWGYAPGLDVDRLAAACPTADDVAGRSPIIASLRRLRLDVIRSPMSGRWGAAAGGPVHRVLAAALSGTLDGPRTAPIPQLRGGALEWADAPIGTMWADLVAVEGHGFVSDAGELAGVDPDGLAAALDSHAGLDVGVTYLAWAAGDGWAAGANVMRADGGLLFEPVGAGPVPAGPQDWTLQTVTPPADLAEAVRIIASRWDKNRASPGAGMGDRFGDGPPMMAHLTYGLRKTLHRFSPRWH